MATSGAGLVLEVALTAAGIVLGLAAAGLMTVYCSPRTGKPASRAGVGYAAVWIAVIAARAAFSYGSVYWFGPQLGRWTATNAISSAVARIVGRAGVSGIAQHRADGMRDVAHPGAGRIPPRRRLTRFWHQLGSGLTAASAGQSLRSGVWQPALPHPAPPGCASLPPS